MNRWTELGTRLRIAALYWRAAVQAWRVCGRTSTCCATELAGTRTIRPLLLNEEALPWRVPARRRTGYRTYFPLLGGGDFSARAAAHIAYLLYYATLRFAAFLFFAALPFAWCRACAGARRRGTLLPSRKLTHTVPYGGACAVRTAGDCGTVAARQHLKHRRRAATRAG